MEFPIEFCPTHQKKIVTKSTKSWRIYIKPTRLERNASTAVREASFTQHEGHQRLTQLGAAHNSMDTIVLWSLRGFRGVRQRSGSRTAVRLIAVVFPLSALELNLLKSVAKVNFLKRYCEIINQFALNFTSQLMFFNISNIISMYYQTKKSASLLYYGTYFMHNREKVSDRLCYRLFVIYVLTT